MKKTSLVVEDQTASVAETELDLARNALSYDLKPYSSHPFPQTAPSRVSAIAQLFGLSPVAPTKARVLELGCSSAGNIIPLAAHYPNAQFVGVDISRIQIAEGRGRIDNLSLKNISLRCESFTECDAAVLGKFDYVIVHGVYSWVAAPVREAMLDLIGKVLNDNGVAYISYNVLPGWRIPQTLRDALVHIVPTDAPMEERVRVARFAIRFIAESSSDQSLYGKGLREWAAQLEGLPDDYLVHEFLEPVNQPCTVSEFLNSADKHGLAYLGESDLPTMVPENAVGDRADAIRQMTGNNIIAVEQFIDLINGRTFRQSLLVKTAAAAKINRNLSPASLDKLHFVCDHSYRASDGSDGDLFTALDGAGRTVTATSFEVGKALQHIQKLFPQSFTVASLCKDLGIKQAEGREAIADLILRMVLAGLLVPMAEKIVATDVAKTKPLATSLARTDALQGLRFTTNSKHERVEIDPAARIALPLLDGESDRDTLTNALINAGKSGQLAFAKDGVAISDESELAGAAQQVSDQVLQGLAQTRSVVWDAEPRSATPGATDVRLLGLVTVDSKAVDAACASERLPNTKSLPALQPVYRLAQLPSTKRTS